MADITTSNGAVFTAKTATFTSAAVSVQNWVDIVLQFIVAGGSTGVTFTVDGSNDGVNWVTSIAFKDPVATASATYKTSSAVNATTAAGYVPNGWKMIRVVATVTDGTASCYIQGRKYNN